ncbi:hypothetical protein SLEP1_g7035 [Rubroshorea leprosula]|uniref:Uncharacterized protein n=1 Tax=Rubroshorea leprosula TaxID=152421 RepID=A0AAV5HX34_9ROSI|nr:hypothetical protein SLEP1_g7035 [Rubroshorea leprosula]
MSISLHPLPPEVVLAFSLTLHFLFLLLNFPSIRSTFLQNGSSTHKNSERVARVLGGIEKELKDGSLSIESPRPQLGERGFFGRLERDWEVLDTCLNASAMILVGGAYGFLKNRGFLPNFGRFSSIVLEGPRDVTPSVLKSSTGLDVSKLSPKKWGSSETSIVALVALLGGVSYLLFQGIDISPNLAAILGLAFMTLSSLGTLFAWSFCMFSSGQKADEVSSAYLMGCPICGVILDPIAAMQMGIQGQQYHLLWTPLVTEVIKAQLSFFLQAGTQFWDEKMSNELAEGQLSGSAFDRYCMMLFAGIAAEAMVYGEAEGGENDENMFSIICVLLQPPLSVAQVQLQGFIFMQ